MPKDRATSKNAIALCTHLAVNIDKKGNLRMKVRTKFYLFPVLAVFFFVQLTGLLFRTEASPWSGTSTGIAAQAGEWQLLPLPPPWEQPPPPGDGNMKINVIKFDQSGGEVEATIQQSSEVCRERDKIEVIGFTWTFTAPITRLRPGATVPVDIKVRLIRGNPACSSAEGRTELFLHRTDSGVDPPFMPFKGIWQPFSDAYAPGVPRANFYLQPPGAEKGKSGFKINDSTPGANDPKFGWFAFTINTTATRTGAQNQYVHFFYKYAFGVVAPEMFYEHIAFNGASFSATADLPFVGWEWNDRISSVRVPLGKVVVLYEHRDYGGQMLKLTSDSPDLRQFAGPGRDRTWNDAASSIRLFNAP